MPIVTALDDTHLPKAGKKTPGVGWRRDPMGPPFQCNLIRAQRFIQMSVMLVAADGPTRPVALPIRFDHAPSVPKPKRSAPPEAWKAYRQQARQDNLSTRGLAVIAPVGYRLGKNSKLLYRKPAYLICLDPELPLDKIVQYYLWRWPIEGNPRDEKQAVGVGEAQVRAVQSVGRQPAFAVASHAMLRRAGVQAFGLEATESTVPPPKWRASDAKQGLSVQDLIQQLRREVWAYALDQLSASSGSFTTMLKPVLKLSKGQRPLASAAVYATNGR